MKNKSGNGKRVLLAVLAAFVGGLIGHQTKPVVDAVFHPRDAEGFNRISSYTVGSIILEIFKIIMGLALAEYFTRERPGMNEEGDPVTIRELDFVPFEIVSFLSTALPVGLATFCGWVLYDATMRLSTRR